MRDKLFIISMLICFGISAHSQQTFQDLPPKKDAKTLAGTRLIFESYKGDNGYIAKVTQYYFDMIDKRNVFTSVSIHETDLKLFKQEFEQVSDYYVKWGVTAELNDIKAVEKEIPVKITSVKDLGCFAYAWNSDKKLTRFIFKIIDSKPYCIFQISLGFQNRRYYVTDWWFSDGEVLGFIDEIKDIIKKQKAFDNKKSNIESLFH